MRPINMIDLRGIDLNLLVSLDCSFTIKSKKLNNKDENVQIRVNKKLGKTQSI
jgi:hypothetical protein